MLKYFKYTNRMIILHTIYFIIISMILSSISFFAGDSYKLPLIIIFSTILFFYFFYIGFGYLYIFIKYIKERKKEGSLLYQYRNDNIFRVTVANSVSAIYAFLYAIFSHIMMYLTNSYFYLFIEVVYIAIGLMKIYLILHVTNFNEKKKKIDIFINIFLVSMSILMFLCAILIYTNRGTFEKYSILVYAYALYAFYSLISAIISFVKARRGNNQIRQRFFIVKFACAIFSMYVLMVSLLNQFSNTDPSRYELIGGIALGAVIFLEFLSICYVKNRNKRMNIEQ